MPDKEFDNLFRDRFMDAEIEPSANLWAKIEEQLEPKRKRVFPIYWMAAASIAVAFTAILVLQDEDKIQLRIDDTAAKVIQPSIDQSLNNLTDVTVPVSQETTEQVKVSSTRLTKSSAVSVSTLLSENNSKNNPEALQPIENIARLHIKQADAKPIDVLPVNEVPVENPIVIAQVEPQQKVDNNIISEIDNTSERKGIRNVGDLVNYVVDKVDKRDKKILRFNTDDDDNSSIVGINIGFLKFNKKNR